MPRQTRRTKMDQELLEATEPWRGNGPARPQRPLLDQHKWLRTTAKAVLVAIAFLVLCLAFLGWMDHDGYDNSPGRAGVSHIDLPVAPAVRR